MSAEQFGTSPQYTVDKPPFVTEGVFWLDPAVISATGDMINRTKLSTMDLGARTKQAHFPALRSQLGETLMPATISDSEKTEYQRAVDVGFMYGTLIAHKSTPESERPSLSELDAEKAARVMRAIERASSNIDLADKEDNFALFMRLRMIELTEAHSDVLAFCLANAQDHIATVFQTQSEKYGPEASVLDTTRIQTVFYAGALLGAVLAVPASQTDVPTVEILRSPNILDTNISVRAEFESTDNMVNAIDYQLSNKLLMRNVVSDDGRNYISVRPNMMQFGPNMISLPINLTEEDERPIAMYVPLEETRAIIIERNEAAHQATFTLIPTAEYDTNLGPNERIAGLVFDSLCATTYDKAHAASETLIQLATEYLGVDKDAVEYVSQLDVSQETINVDENNKKLGRIALLATTAAAVTVLGLDAAHVYGETPNWAMDAIVIGAIGTMYAVPLVLQRMKNQYKRDVERHNAVLQSTIDDTFLKR